MLQRMVVAATLGLLSPPSVEIPPSQLEPVPMQIIGCQTAMDAMMLHSIERAMPSAAPLEVLIKAQEQALNCAEFPGLKLSDWGTPPDDPYAAFVDQGAIYRLHYYECQDPRCPAPDLFVFIKAGE
jgi:hypothetical protein